MRNPNDAIMTAAGDSNLITDVDGVTVGHATDETAGTGVTVLRCREAMVAAVDVRGGAPGVRETDVLAPENLVGKVDAIALTGGSVFGLGAADGVATTLSAGNVGLRISDKGPAIPIVAAAVLHDLGNDGDKAWGAEPPYRRLGVEALENAARDFALGAIGAGRGAMAGNLKGGIGSASARFSGGYVVGALAAVNPVGAVVMPDGETFYAWPWEVNEEFGGRMPTGRDVAGPFPPYSRLAAARPAGATTLAIVAVNAALDGVEAKRIAIMAQDGVARAVRPAHTPFDGDIVFAIASGERPAPERGDPHRHVLVAALGSLAADCLARAIARGVFEARNG